MLFKNAFHLLVDNFSLNYKYLLYKIIVCVIAVGLAAALIVPNVAFLFNSAEFKSLIDLIKDFLRALVSGDVEFLNGFPSAIKECVQALGDLIVSRTGRFVFVFVAAIVVILVYRFLSGMGNFVFGGLIDDKMSSYAKTSFSSSYIKNLGRAALWQIIYVPVTFVYDVAVLAICYVFFLVLLNVISFARATMRCCNPPPERSTFCTLRSGWRQVSIVTATCACRCVTSVNAARSRA